MEERFCFSMSSSLQSTALLYLEVGAPGQGSDSRLTRLAGRSCLRECRSIRAGRLWKGEQLLKNYQGTSLMGHRF
jgi:hypothetical protein